MTTITIDETVGGNASGNLDPWLGRVGPERKDAVRDQASTQSPQSDRDWGSDDSESDDFRTFHEPVVSREADEGRPPERFVSLQAWQGVVEEIKLSEQEFTAILFDMTAAGPKETATFDFADVSQGDANLLRPGAVFYWAVGYRTAPSGQRSRVSILQFRRMPTLSTEDLGEAFTAADALLRELRWD